MENNLEGEINIEKEPPQEQPETENNTATRAASSLDDPTETLSDYLLTKAFEKIDEKKFERLASSDLSLDAQFHVS